MIEQMILIGLAAWRVAALLSYERGPFDVLVRFRELFGIIHNEHEDYVPYGWPENPAAQLLSCVWCLGLYAAVAMYGLWQLEPVAVMVVAAASIVVMVEKWNHQ